jgi:hypothetical protein
MTARGARIAGDFRALDLDDARVLLPGATPIALHVDELSMHGMAPWARASTLPAVLRAPLLAIAAWASASIAAYAVLRSAARARLTRLGVIVVGAGGPLCMLGLLRLLERAGTHAAAFLLLPVAACAVTAACAGLLSRLRRTGGAASKWIKV